MSRERKRCGELSGKLNVKGEPCKAFARKDKTTCIGHADKAEQAEAGFGGPENGRKGGEARRVPTATELMRRVVEENVEKILAPHFKALGYTLSIEDDGEGPVIALEPIEGGGAKLYGESREGVVKASAFEDLGAQLAAAERLLDRALGKPKQATEITGPGGGPISHEHVAVPTDPEFQHGVAAVLAEAEAIKANAAGASG